MPPSFEFAWSTKAGKFHRSKKPITTEEELKRAVAHRSSQGDACYRSVYNFTDFNIKTSAIINTIYIDLDDSENPQLALDDAAKIAHHIGDHTIQWFSGMKGIGMEILCYPVDLIPLMKSAVLRRYALNLVDALNLTTADHAVMGDINRVHRIIDTQHQKTGLYAIGMHQSELSALTINEIKEMATRPRGIGQDVQPSMDVSEQLSSIEETLLIERLQRLVDKKVLASTTFDNVVERLPTHSASRLVVIEFIQSLEDEYRAVIAANAPSRSSMHPYLAEALESLLTHGQLTNGKDRGAEHQRRVWFCHFAHENGMSFNEICNAFVNVVDGNGNRCYDAKMTEDQVRSCIR